MYYWLRDYLYNGCYNRTNTTSCTIQIFSIPMCLNYKFAWLPKPWSLCKLWSVTLSLYTFSIHLDRFHLYSNIITKFNTSYLSLHSYRLTLLDYQIAVLTSAAKLRLVLVQCIYNVPQLSLVQRVIVIFEICSTMLVLILYVIGYLYCMW